MIDIWAEAKKLWVDGHTLDEIVSIILNDYGKTISRSTVYYRAKKQGWKKIGIAEYERQEKQKELKRIMKKFRCSLSTAYKYLAVKKFLREKGMREHIKDIEIGKHKKSIDYNYEKMWQWK
jgi:hypothetical protein